MARGTHRVSRTLPLESCHGHEEHPKKQECHAAARNQSTTLHELVAQKQMQRAQRSIRNHSKQHTCIQLTLSRSAKRRANGSWLGQDETSDGSACSIAAPRSLRQNLPS